MGPNALRYSERVLAILRAGGVRCAGGLGYTLMFSVVNGFTMDETGEGGEPPAGRPASDQIAAIVRDYMDSLPRERFPNLVAGRRPVRVRRPGAAICTADRPVRRGLAQRADQG
jgi:hypothetical protein